MDLAVKPAQSGGHGAGGDEVTFEHEGAQENDGNHERHGEIDRGSAGSDGGIGRGIHESGRITKIGFRGNCQFFREKTFENRGFGGDWWGLRAVKVGVTAEICGIRCRNRVYFCCKVMCFLLIWGVTDQVAADIRTGVWCSRMCVPVLTQWPLCLRRISNGG